MTGSRMRWLVYAASGVSIGLVIVAYTLLIWQVSVGEAVLFGVGSTILFPLLLRNQARNVDKARKRKHIITTPPPGGGRIGIYMQPPFYSEPAQVFGFPKSMSKKRRRKLFQTGGFGEEHREQN